MRKIDFKNLPTEKPNPRSKRIDQLPTEKVLQIIYEEDRRVPGAVHREKRKIARGVRLIVTALKNGGRLFFAGAGTSGRLGILEAAECPPTFNTPSWLVRAVMAGGKKAVFRSQEGAEDRREEAFRIFRKKLTKRDVLVGIAASGVTPFVEGALKAAKDKGARTILVACNAASPLGQLADCLISPKVGPEIITGSTRLKAATAAKMILNMLTVTSMIQLGKVYQNWMVDLQPKSRKLRARALRLVAGLGGIEQNEAQHYLKEARNNVKPAILMARKGWSYSQASKKLRQTSGFLRKALVS